MAAQGRDGSTENSRVDAKAPTNAMTVGTSQTCTHAHVLPMQQAQPSPWPAWLAQCASWDIRCETTAPDTATAEATNGIATSVTLVSESASASTQTTTRAARERAMRRRSSGKLVQSSLTACMVRMGRRARKASNH